MRAPPVLAVALLLAACDAPAPPVATQDAAVTQADTAADTAADAPAAVAEYVATEADFDCIKSGVKVHKYYIASRVAPVAEAVAVAQGNVKGAQFPVGTIIRLFPLEAMVKRGGTGFAATGGWEMFKLGYDGDKVKITARGGLEVGNAGGSCAGCHLAAKDYDFICGADGHGCAPIPVSAEAAVLLQDSDPTCPATP